VDPLESPFIFLIVADQFEDLPVSLAPLPLQWRRAVSHPTI
jgi:hypothetical protein